MSEFLRSFGALFAIANPVAAAPLFVALTKGQTPAQRRRSAALAAGTVLVVLVVAAVGGRTVLDIFGISVPAFRTAGGLVIGLMGLEMLGGTGTRVQGTTDTDPSGSIVVPFAMPLVAGPGAITTVITLTTAAGGRLSTVVAAIVALAVVLLAILLVAVPIDARFSERAHAIFWRFMGLLLVGIGTQFVLSGVREFVAGG